MASAPDAGGKALAPPPSTAQPKKDPDELAEGPKRQTSNGSTTHQIDVREALSKCVDPSMAWSMQFWVTIADPLTRDVFFACPASGQCSWEPPVGAFVVPRSPDGEWWELADPSRDNQSYYYNTLTCVTQWNRPDGDAFVIPLGLMQRNELSSRPPSLHRDSTESDTIVSTSSSIQPAISSSGHREQLSLPIATSTASSSGPLTPIPDDAPMPDRPPGPAHDQQGSWWGRRRGRRLLSRLSKTNLKTPDRSPSLTNGGTTHHTDHSPALSNSNGFVASPPGSPSMDDGSFNDPVNLVLQPASPTSAAYNLENFSTDNFADRYFASRRSGVLRQRMSLEQIMEWQRAPITSPLLVLSRSSVQDAVTTFKVIQHVMGDRDRHVTDARLQHIPTASVLSLRSTSRPGDPNDAKDEKTVILEEIRWMIQLGVGRVEMRDELFCQLMKQLTRNPDNDSTVLGFQLFCVFVSAFGPSKSFEPFVRSFLIGKLERTDFGIGVMSKFCLTRLDTWSQKGGRGRVLSTAEIEHASDAAFYPSVYAQTLETIMQRQEGAYPELRIPIILPFLADGILALGGTESEGIFRVPGDNDVIQHLKSRIDRGQYQLSGITDPHVVASLFKMWLRELEDPLIPTVMYETALEVSRSVDHTILFLKKLPNHNRRVLLFVISFIQLFLDPEVVAITKMTPRNLALVLAPNILRTPDESLSAAFANSGYECQFVLNLLLHLDPPSVDPDYVPSHGGGASGRGSLDSQRSERSALSGDVSVDISGHHAGEHSSRENEAR
ncbi:hypothetical protein CcaverHIS002_0107640 [Cutaneotrichosporon cavernicola]|uniref:RhoGAP-domain-containing protein n=1 Tax=Cutaneotrichosporon cavernicola TaxID=279322 RepID=A0AA48L0V7_9TREE|nr:uncharacterized protein CcaverHIS019_0107600 [Cutaneotrichosporon cavernicola]BEI80235.1 hypothetical protein CcaverHIS002_0107640 [Cutaneotrichosporon cavernicola]BEI88042.1 hypothetical protein CcaverHIS019_0107600 [Cutaneotrichosporon cavernicola]BEI95814.1 hypothetical protein CcaverHIS631_0107630 [Cutaneotrichosporon cavernicola]BEJ03587.1 hypothetical protein CcaverHIS641_0107620 [Cutaneotrichosporon cavernicola]